MSQNGFCAFCRSPKVFFKRKRLGVLNILAAVAISLAINYIFSHQVEPVVFVIFIATLFVNELILQVRWRMSLICHECGFDPVIYKRNPELACQMVKTRIEKRKEDPIKSTFFPLLLPKRKESKLEKLESTQI